LNYVIYGKKSCLTNSYIYLRDQLKEVVVPDSLLFKSYAKKVLKVGSLEHCFGTQL
jgi:hypothetical protein